MTHTAKRALHEYALCIQLIFVTLEILCAVYLDITWCVNTDKYPIIFDTQQRKFHTITDRNFLA